MGTSLLLFQEQDALAYSPSIAVVEGKKQYSEQSIAEIK